MDCLSGCFCSLEGIGIWKDTESNLTAFSLPHMQQKEAQQIESLSCSKHCTECQKIVGSRRDTSHLFPQPKRRSSYRMSRRHRSVAPQFHMLD